MRGLIKVQYRRRAEGKTDYAARKKFLEGKKPRIIVRKTNRYIIAQLVESKEAQDKVVCSVNSKELVGYGWPNKYSIKNLAASYLAGYLLGKKMKQKKYQEAILDIGLIRSTKGNRMYAVLKGAVDAGIEIPFSEEILPSEKRIKGEHLDENLKNIFEKVKGEIEKIK